MGPLGRAARSGVIYSISRVGATRWSQWLDTVAVYYPIPIECNNPYRSRHLLRGEMCMEQRLLAPLRTGPQIQELRQNDKRRKLQEENI